MPAHLGPEDEKAIYAKELGAEMKAMAHADDHPEDHLGAAGLRDDGGKLHNKEDWPTNDEAIGYAMWLSALDDVRCFSIAPCLDSSSLTHRLCHIICRVSQPSIDRRPRAATG